MSLDRTSGSRESAAHTNAATRQDAAQKATHTIPRPECVGRGKPCGRSDRDYARGETRTEWCDRCDGYQVIHVPAWVARLHAEPAQ